ncbi:MAG: hypothetical protein R6V53_05135 [Candidatus Woesearchaeota archaeon]
MECPHCGELVKHQDAFCHTCLNVFDEPIRSSFPPSKIVRKGYLPNLLSRI